MEGPGGFSGTLLGHVQGLFFDPQKTGPGRELPGPPGSPLGGSGGALGGSLESQGLKLEPTCGAGLSKTASKFMRVAAFWLPTGHFSVHMGTWPGAYDCLRHV